MSFAPIDGLQYAKAESYARRRSRPGTGGHMATLLMDAGAQRILEEVEPSTWMTLSSPLAGKTHWW